MHQNSESGFWREDQKRYGRMAWLVQPSYWAVMIYRFGRWTKTTGHPLGRPAHAIYFVAYSIIRLVTGIEIPRGATFGPGLLIHHYGGIVINPRAVVGAYCTLRQGVTIGTRHDDAGAPVLGDNVVLGAYAQILGAIRIGDGVTIGAMTLVMTDVPDGRTAVGVPARILNARS